MTSVSKAFADSWLLLCKVYEIDNFSIKDAIYFP